MAEPAPVATAPGACTVTWLGHACAVIDLDGTRLVTDPAVTRRLAHLRRMVPRPEIPVGVDAALISHLHHDHLHTPSLRRVGPAAIVAPTGSRRLFPAPLDRLLIEVTAGQDTTIGRVHVAAVHAEHDGRRSRGRLAAPALGYVVEGTRRVYFAGDTDLFPAMADLASPPIDIALLPIWGWGPSLGAGHLNPFTAAQALTLLRPRIVIPIHWGTYAPPWTTSGRRYLSRPAEDFARHAARVAPDVDVRVLAPGEAVTLAGPPAD